MIYVYGILIASLIGIFGYLTSKISTLEENNKVLSNNLFVCSSANAGNMSELRQIKPYYEDMLKKNRVIEASYIEETTELKKLIISKPSIVTKEVIKLKDCSVKIKGGDDEISTVISGIGK